MNQREGVEKGDSLFFCHGGVVALKERLNKESECAGDTHYDKNPEEEPVNHHGYILPVLNDLHGTCKQKKYALLQHTVNAYSWGFSTVFSCLPVFSLINSGSFLRSRHGNCKELTSILTVPFF